MVATFSIPERGARLYLAKIGLILKDAKLVVTRYCSSTSTEASKWDINQSISMSIMVLGETLRWAMNQLRDEVRSPVLGWITDDDHGWGTSQLLLSRMLNRRWCPHSIYMFQGLTKGSISGRYYASTFPDPPDSQKGRDHSNCSAEQCNANAISTEAYQLRHTTEIVNALSWSQIATRLWLF